MSRLVGFMTPGSGMAFVNPEKVAVVRRYRGSELSVRTEIVLDCGERVLTEKKTEDVARLLVDPVGCWQEENR